MIILASKSPRRKELLKTIINDFIIVPSNVDEFKYPLDQLSRVKALEIASRYPNDIIISADTIVLFNDQVFGKPQSVEEAYLMLKNLSNNVHIVKTIYTILDNKNNIEITKSVISKVYFNNLTDELINQYIESKSPLDKAGAYGIQDNEKYHLINKIEGSYSNIVGLPLEEISNDLIKIGII